MTPPIMWMAEEDTCVAMEKTMITEKTAAKKILAVTLALGFSLPGAAWSQAFTARVAPGAGAGAEAAAASYAGAQTITLSIPAPSATPSAPSPAALIVAAAVPAAVLAVPSAVESHSASGLPNQLKKPDAVKDVNAARALPEGPSTDSPLVHLAASIHASRDGEIGSDSGVQASAKAFDGAKAAAPAAEPVVAFTGGVLSRLARLLPAPIRGIVRGPTTRAERPAVNLSAIAALRSVLPNGYWGAEIPNVKPSKDVYGRPNEDYAEVGVESYSHAEPSFSAREDISLHLKYHSDSRYKYVGFALSDAPGRYHVTRFERTANRIVVETRIREWGWDSNGNRERVTITLNSDGKAVGMMIENWNSRAPFLKSRRSAVLSPETKPAPFVYLPKA